MPGGSVCSSPFAPVPSAAVAGEDSSNILVWTPASASQCHRGPDLVVSGGKTNSLHIPFSSTTSTSDFLRLVFCTTALGGAEEMRPSDSVWGTTDLPPCLKLSHTPKGNSLKIVPRTVTGLIEVMAKICSWRGIREGLQDCTFQSGDEREGMIKVY